QYSQAMAPRDNLKTAVGSRRGVERDPNRNQRIAIEGPHISAVLVPRESGALKGRLVKHHGPEDRDGGMPAVVTGADFQKERMPEQAREELVVLESMDP